MKSASEIYQNCQPEPKKGEKRDIPFMWQLLAMQEYAEQAIEAAALNARTMTNQESTGICVDKGTILIIKHWLK